MKYSRQSFAARLEALFETKRKPDGKKYTQKEVVQATQGALTRVYLWELRSGRADNPSFNVVCALADFFEVSLEYFKLDQHAGSEQIERARQDALLEQITQRAAKLDQAGKKALLGILDYLVPHG